MVAAESDKRDRARLAESFADWALNPGGCGRSGSRYYGKDFFRSGWRANNSADSHRQPFSRAGGTEDPALTLKETP